MKRSYVLLFLLVLILFAYPIVAVCVDSDGDTYGMGCSKEDCNDNDPFVNPGVPDVCKNGIDDNCNGEIDETGCSYCVDHDGDGYGNPGSTSCTKGANTDCDDTNKDTNHGIAEDTFTICTDGKDNNCNGLVDKDDASCAKFYSTPEQLIEGTGEGTGGCTISNPQWMSAGGEVITGALPGEDIAAIAVGSNCEDVEVTISIQKYEEQETIDETATFFGEARDEEGNTISDYVIYQTTAPTTPGEYIFLVSSDATSVTSDVLTVGGEPSSCEVQWDCSSLPYGECINGLKSRNICPGNENACCTDETTCECAAILPEGDCEEYTYATPQYQKSCAPMSSASIEGSGAKKATADEETELGVTEPEFPWTNIIFITVVLLAAIGGGTYYLMTKKSSSQIPASLINYVKAAKAKKIPDDTIKQALQKSGWKPEQINEALKAK